MELDRDDLLAMVESLRGKLFTGWLDFEGGRELQRGAVQQFTSKFEK